MVRASWVTTNGTPLKLIVSTLNLVLSKYLLGNADLGDLAQLVARLLGGDAVDGEAALDVIDETEGLIGLVNGDDVHEAGGEGGVASDFTVNLDEIVLDGLKYPQTGRDHYNHTRRQKSSKISR